MPNAISKSYDVEFNDSVLDLQGWKGPRTEGSKLTGQFVNYYNSTDKTFGKNPVIENKIAALYLGNTIIGGDNEDASRVTIAGHSYVSIDRVLIVDIDTDDVEIIDRINMNPIAFGRMVRRDLPEFSRVNVKLLDFSTQNNVKPQHFVKFNQGSLMKVYNYEANDLGYEDGVFGGFGIRQNKLFENDQGIKFYGKSQTIDGVTSTIDQGLFSYGMTTCVSNSLFEEAPQIISESINTLAGITESIVVQEFHPAPFTFISKFPAELDKYTGDVTMETLGNTLHLCTASINTQFNIGLAITQVFTGPKDNSGVSTGPSNTSPTGGKILCQEFYDQGLMPQDIYEADELYGDKVYETDPDLMKGYWLWASTAVDFCRKYPMWTKALYYTLGRPWAEHMAFLMGKRKKDNPFGKILMDMGSFITKKLYKMSTLNKVTKFGYQNK